MLFQAFCNNKVPLRSGEMTNFLVLMHQSFNHCNHSSFTFQPKLLFRTFFLITGISTHSVHFAVFSPENMTDYCQNLLPFIKKHWKMKFYPCFGNLCVANIFSNLLIIRETYIYSSNFMEQYNNWKISKNSTTLR